MFYWRSQVLNMFIWKVREFQLQGMLPVFYAGEGSYYWDTIFAHAVFRGEEPSKKSYFNDRLTMYEIIELSKIANSAENCQRLCKSHNNLKGSVMKKICRAVKFTDDREINMARFIMKGIRGVFSTLLSYSRTETLDQVFFSMRNNFENQFSNCLELNGDWYSNNPLW